jgi:tol-pal system protein YbgF
MKHRHLSAPAILLIMLVGCNTVRGVGEDIDAGMDRIQGQPDSSAATIEPEPETALLAAPAPPPPAPTHGDVIITPPDDTAPETAFAQAMSTFRAKNYADALIQFDSFTFNHPTSSLVDRAYLLKGECYYRQGNNPQAMLEFSNLQKRHPDSQYVPHAMYREALTLRNIGKKDYAIAKLERLIMLYPGSQAAKSANTTLSQLR